ncbi:MAG: amidohydrolase family protein [Armatimonadota bacterium]
MRSTRGCGEATSGARVPAHHARHPLMPSVILAGSLIDGAGGPPAHGAAVVVERGKIIAVRTGPGWKDTHGDGVVDCTDLTVLPGMIDAHVHLTFNAGPDNADVIQTLVTENDMMLALRAMANAQDALRAGVTTVRDCGGRGLATLAVRDAVARGLVTGPRILVSGMPITTTAGHLHYCGLLADTSDELRQAVRAMCEAGVDFIKICATGGMMTEGSHPLRPQYGPDDLQITVKEAHHLGRPVAAHVLNAEAIRYCVAAGVDTFEHCLWQAPDGRMEYDEAVALEIVRSRRHVGVTGSGVVRQLLPAAGDLPDEGAKKHAALWERFAGERAMRASGVRMMLHTDAGVRFTPFAEFARALEVAILGIGITPMEAISMVTRVPAEGLGLGADLGTVEPGKQADLVAVEGDPLADVSNLGRVRYVWRDGRMVVHDGMVSSPLRPDASDSFA